MIDEKKLELGRFLLDKIDECNDFYKFIEHSWGLGPCLSIEEKSMRYPPDISLKIHNGMKDIVKEEILRLHKAFEEL